MCLCSYLTSQGDGIAIKLHQGRRIRGDAPTLRAPSIDTPPKLGTACQLKKTFLLQLAKSRHPGPGYWTFSSSVDWLASGMVASASCYLCQQCGQQSALHAPPSFTGFIPFYATHTTRTHTHHEEAYAERDRGGVIHLMAPRESELTTTTQLARATSS